jgi:hypothetical protein
MNLRNIREEILLVTWDYPQSEDQAERVRMIACAASARSRLRTTWPALGSGSKRERYPATPRMSTRLAWRTRPAHKCEHNDGEVERAKD